MKKAIGIIAGFLFVCSLSAQSINRGDWLGKTPSGETYKMLVQGGQEGEPLKVLVIEDEARVSLRGRFQGQLLKFKTSGGILVLKRQASARSFRNEKGFLMFAKPGTRISAKPTAGVVYKYVSGPPVLSGWDEGVAAVVYNEGVAAAK